MLLTDRNVETRQKRKLHTDRATKRTPPNSEMRKGKIIKDRKRERRDKSNVASSALIVAMDLVAMDLVAMDLVERRRRKGKRAQVSAGRVRCGVGEHLAGPG